jgi:hypothetical protein
VDSRRRAIEEFLAAHPGCFCADCLAVAVDIPARQVSMVRQRLVSQGRCSALHAACSGCSRKRLVVKVA